MLGQDGSVRLLKARLKNGTALDTSYIFSGPFGSGKTTIARIHARAMLCQQIDKSDPEPCNECDNCKAILDETSAAFVEFDAASRGTVDNIRGIVDTLAFSVFGAAKRVYLLDECFTEDTLLRTSVGWRSIRELVEARDPVEVLSYDTTTHNVVWRPLTDWFELTTERDVLRLVLDNGEEIIVTPDQEIYTRNRGWVTAESLTEDDDILEVACPPL